MNLFFEIVKLIVELLIIILVSKNLLVPIIRKLGEKLKLKPHTIGTSLKILIVFFIKKYT